MYSVWCLLSRFLANTRWHFVKLNILLWLVTRWFHATEALWSQTYKKRLQHKSMATCCFKMFCQNRSGGEICKNRYKNSEVEWNVEKYKRIGGPISRSQWSYIVYIGTCLACGCLNPFQHDLLGINVYPACVYSPSLLLCYWNNM